MTTRATRQATTRLRIGIIVSMIATAFVLVPATATAQQAPPVVISEFVASNQSGLADNTGAFSDWIELHNESGVAVDLVGWTLSAGADVHTFSSLTVSAGEYLVVFASGDPTRSVAGELHVDFRLSANGESLVLADAVGEASSPSWPVSYPAQVVNVSYGSDTNGDLFFFDPATPGASNGSGGLGGFVEPVTFSVDHGYFDTAQSVVLSSTTASSTIRYTVDGSTPSQTNGTAVASGATVLVDQTTVLRAVALRSGWLTSAPETRSYLFADEIAQRSETVPTGWPTDNSVNSMRAFYGMDANLTATERADAAAALTAIPSISITTDLDNLFDPTTGIWANPRSRGSAWERPASIELIDPTGNEPGFEINGGLRIKGNSSRSPNNFKHSMRLVFDNDYGDGELNYPVHGPDGVDIFESLDLKTAQSWSWNRTAATLVGRGTEATWLRDVWNRDTLGDMGHLYTRSKYVHAFINGEYWGLYYTEERAANQYASQYLGGNESDYDVIKQDFSTGTRTVSARDGNLDAWLSLWPMVQDHTLDDAEWARFQDEVNVENLAEYYLQMWVAGDSDSTPRFTLDRSNNWISVRDRTGQGAGGKWVFVDKDSESALCTNVNAGRMPDWNPTPPWNLDASLGLGIPDEYHLTPAWLFEAALTRPEFVQIFKDRVQVHMLTPGGALTVAESEARFDTRYVTVEAAIDAEAARWGNTWTEPGFDRANWEPASQTVRDCFQLRTTVMEQYLREDGLWPLSAPPVISPDAGTVDAGTLVSLSGQPGADVWVTTNGSDPLGANDQPSASAFLYTSPFAIDESTLVNARALTSGDWSPLASAQYTVDVPAGPARVILNEWNAVDSDAFLKNGGSDSGLGTILGNGGDWFELVVIEDELDLRGWTLEISDDDNAAAVQEVTDVFEFASDDLLASLRAGTIITVSEDFADDVSYDPVGGDWNINLQANSDDEGAFFTPDSQSNFGVNNQNWQLTIRDAAGQVVFGPAGEGVGASGVGSDEIGELEADPTSAITPTSAYDDGDDSTFGEPNGFDGRVQDFSLIRPVFADTAEPDSTIEAPTVSQVLTDSAVMFAGTATDNVDVDAVDVAVRNRDTGDWLRVDGSYGNLEWHTASVDTVGAPSTPWSYSLTLPDGRWLVTSRAQDGSGNRDSDRPANRFVVESAVADTEDPDAEIVAPTLRETVDGPSVVVSGSATDNIAVALVRITIKSRDTNLFLQADGSFDTAFARIDTVLSAPETTSTDWTFSADLPDGDYAATIDVTDLAGNRDATRARVGRFTVQSAAADIVEPDTVVDAPAAGQTLVGPVIAAGGTASDDVGVTRVRVGVQDLTTKLWLQADGSLGSFVLLEADLVTPGGLTTGWTISLNAPAGTYALTARAIDAAGNTDSTRPRVRFDVS